MKVKRAVVIWLFCGLILVFFQIIIGGITRLTGSGLSITKWEIVTGTIPPLTEAEWNDEFAKYKQTPQYEKINIDMELGSVWNGGTFKFIYFWEYFHRLWAKAMGLIFLLPFLFFYYKGWLTKILKRDLLVVFCLAVLAAIFGWIMVASGLVNRPWVNAYKLSIHLSIGMSVFGYLLWTILKYLYKDKSLLVSKDLSFSFVLVLMVLITTQLFLGGIMSGMKAALIYPTWPEIGTSFVPMEIFDGELWTVQSFIHYDTGSFVFSLIHFLHRTTAYLIVVMMVWYAWRYQLWLRNDLVRRSYYLSCILLICQVILGIVTLLNSIGVVPVLWGVLHQGMAVLFLGSFIVHLFYIYYGRQECLI